MNDLYVREDAASRDVHYTHCTSKKKTKFVYQILKVIVTSRRRAGSRSGPVHEIPKFATSRRPISCSASLQHASRGTLYKYLLLV